MRRISPEERATLDLSHWRMAVNGAEPIRHDTVERFCSTFAECGFRPEAFFPSYGLAEATLLVTGGHGAAASRVSVWAREEHLLVPVTGEGQDSRVLVSSDRVWGGQRVLVVDPEARKALPDGRIGEIWIQGPSVAQGYWKRPDATEKSFKAKLDTGEGPFLRTGDLGCFQDGELFVAGRLKDMLIIRGRSLYLQDIERTAEEAHPAIEATCVAAFAVEAEGEEQLVVAAEVNRHAWGKAGVEEELMVALRQAVAEVHCVRLHDVLLLRPASIPKTPAARFSAAPAGSCTFLHQ